MAQRYNKLNNIKQLFFVLDEIRALVRLFLSTFSHEIRCFIQINLLIIFTQVLKATINYCTFITKQNGLVEKAEFIPSILR